MIYEKLMKKIPESKIDPYFGISYNAKGEFFMGKTNVEILGDDIIVDGVTYKGTLGLWSLILLKKPNNYTPDDMKEYKKLVKKTNVMTHPQNLKPNSQPERTWKWRNIFKKTVKKGDGIEFLPSDIISLQNGLAYLLGEYRADNTSATRNQIVAIADNLLKENILQN